MKSIKSKLKLLQETIDYYSVDPKNRRCITKLGSCVYSPSNSKTPELTEGCAVGRLISTELKIELDRIEGTVNNSRIFDKLPKKIQDYGMQFLRELQILHDNSHYWSIESKGLSLSGKENVAMITKEINKKQI